MRNRFIVPVLALALLPAGGCAPDGVFEADTETTRDAASDSIASVAYTELAVVDAPGGAVVEFRQLEDGTIVVSEQVRTGRLSPMDALMTGQRATPLELYMALALEDRPAPAALRRSHEDFALANRSDPTPRRLSLLPALTTESSGTYSWKYAADCDLADDGGWFDHFWQTYNWRWHWYRRTNSYDGWSATTPKTNAVQTHLCNDGPTGNKIHRIMRSSCGSSGGWLYIFTATVQPEYRSQFRVWNSPYACRYQHKSSNPIGSSHYPVYSYGITTP